METKQWIWLVLVKNLRQWSFRWVVVFHPITIESLRQESICLILLFLIVSDHETGHTIIIKTKVWLVGSCGEGLEVFLLYFVIRIKPKRTIKTHLVESKVCWLLVPVNQLLDALLSVFFDFWWVRGEVWSFFGSLKSHRRIWPSTEPRCNSAVEHWGLKSSSWGSNTGLVWCPGLLGLSAIHLAFLRKLVFYFNIVNPLV